MNWTDADRERFWSKVELGDGCWKWTGYVNEDGYGNIAIGRSSAKVHRFSWSLANGPIPAGMYVLHRCDNPPCVRPDHLFLGTQAENMADMRAKGRGHKCRSENGANAKLDRNHAHAILFLRRNTDFTLKQIAAQFGVGISTVHMIETGSRWKDLPR